MAASKVTWRSAKLHGNIYEPLAAFRCISRCRVAGNSGGLCIGARPCAVLAVCGASNGSHVLYSVPDRFHGFFASETVAVGANQSAGAGAALYRTVVRLFPSS